MSRHTDTHISGNGCSAVKLLRQVDSLSQLRSLVDMAARRRGGDGEHLHELAVWSGRHVSRAGVPARSIPQPDASSPVPARVFAGTVLAQPADSIPADENAVVIAWALPRMTRWHDCAREKPPAWCC